MSAVVTVGAKSGIDPVSYPCQVSVNGGAQKGVTVVATAATLSTIPQAEQTAYIEARAMLAAGDGDDATATVTPFATTDPAPNWAQNWIDGAIPS